MSDTWTTRLAKCVRRGLERAGDGAMDYVLTQRIGEKFVGPGQEADWYFETFGRWICFAAGRDIAPVQFDPADVASLDLVHAGAVARCAVLAGEIDETLRAALAARIFDHSADDGFSIVPGGELSSYASYVAAGALDDLGETIDGPAMAAAIGGLCNEDGGISHDHSFRISTTPTTAAGAMLLDRYGAPSEALDGARRYLLAQQIDSGAFRPGAFGGEGDLLSTATAVVALGPMIGEAADTRPFVQSCRGANGGFAPVPSGPADLEYTYYALLVLGAAQ